MKIELKDVNTNKLHDELLGAGIAPKLVESKENTTWVTVDDSEEGTVMEVVVKHDPSPIPLPKTELEMLKEIVEQLVLANLEV